MNTGSTIVLGGVLAIGFLVLFVGSIVWAFQDAETRGKSGCLVAILVAFVSWPLGLVAWLIFRPDGPKKRENVRIAFIPCQCWKRIPVEERMAGTKVTCASCGMDVVVPELSRLRLILAEEGRLGQGAGHSSNTG